MIGTRQILQAFTRLGDQLTIARPVEVLIVGGAAALLTGQLPELWTTSDVDLIHCRLPQDRHAVLETAGEVAKELSLPASWLSDFSGLFAWTLPQGWESRRVLIGTFNRLSVYAVGRHDLLVMKFAAHRSRDLEHLSILNPSLDELRQTDEVLGALAAEFPQYASQIELARDIVAQWGGVK